MAADPSDNLTGVNACECSGDELVEALRVHNSFRARYGSRLIESSSYQKTKPAQRMYSIDIATIELYNQTRGQDGLILYEQRVAVGPKELL